MIARLLDWWRNLPYRPPDALTDATGPGGRVVSPKPDDGWDDEIEALNIDWRGEQ